jgi:voltage-gated potassium channel
MTIEEAAGHPVLDQRSRADVTLSTGWEIFVLVLSIQSILNIAIVALAQLDVVGQIALIVDVILTFVFVVDFVWRLGKSTDRRAYIIHGGGWLDLIACVPGLRIARIFRIIRAPRLIRRLGGPAATVRAMFSSRAEGSLYVVMLIALLLLEYGSMAILAVEARAENGNIKTASDAIWYLIVTMATVGYGDRFPTTNLGRIIGAVIIIIGIGLFSTLTGFLANAFLAPRSSTDEASTEEAPPADASAASPMPAPLTEDGTA